MRISGYWLRKQAAGCLAIVLVVPFGEVATAQQAPSSQQTGAVPPGQAQSQSSGSIAGEQAAKAPKTEAIPDDPNPARPQTTDHNQLAGTPQPAPEQQPEGASAPVGTAAAPYENTTGVAASRPAGAVIAPAKQRRVRSIAIKLGVLLGAGVAIGTVAALSSGSPSRPH